MSLGSNKFYFPALVLSACCLLIPAFYNGYPLVNPDTATFLASGFKPETPFDRPITYGLLVRLFSLNGLSLWSVVFFQGLIVASLIFRLFKRLVGDGTYVLKALLCNVFLSVFTSLSWLVSQVQPDVFTSIAFLTVLLLLLGTETPRANVSLYVLFFIAVAVHMSHPLLMVATLAFVFLLRPVYNGNVAIGRATITMIVLSVASLGLMGSALSKSKHVYFMGSLVEKGVLKQYLDDNCATHNYKICGYKDALGNNVDYFLWDTNSPLYKVGDWKGTKSEFNAIIHDILTTPKYLKLWLVVTAHQWLQQAVTFNIGDGNQAFPVGSNVEQRIQEYFPNEAAAFRRSRQNNTDMLLLLSVPNKVLTAIVLSSLLGMGYIFSRWKNVPREMKMLLVITITGIIINSLDCAAFGTLNGRFGCKVIWLLPLCTWVTIPMIFKKTHL